MCSWTRRRLFHLSKWQVAEWIMSNQTGHYPSVVVALTIEDWIIEGIHVQMGLHLYSGRTISIKKKSPEWLKHGGGKKQAVANNHTSLRRSHDLNMSRPCTRSHGARFKIIILPYMWLSETSVGNERETFRTLKMLQHDWNFKCQSKRYL